MPAPTRSGPTFQINPSDNTVQATPEVTALANGSFMVTWITPNYGSGLLDEVLGQVFRADGARVGTEIRLSTPAQVYDTNPSIAALSNGNVIVCWDTHPQRVQVGSGSATYGQLVNPQGGQIGTDIAVGPGTWTNGVEVAGLNNGRYVTAWNESNPAPGSPNGIHLQIWTGAGTALGSELLVQEPLGTDFSSAEIVKLSSGRFVVTYASVTAVEGVQQAPDIGAQIFFADGTLFRPHQTVNSSTSGFQFDHAVTALKTGGFVTVWVDFTPAGADQSGSAIRGQVFNGAGAKVGSEFLVNTASLYNQDAPDIATLADGRFVVVWADSSRIAGAPGIDIRAQIFNANGSKSGTEFVVNSVVAGWQKAPSVAALADGRFVVTWEDPAPTGGPLDFGNIRAQIFDPRTSAADFAGTSANDSFVGTGFNDTLAGGQGADNLSGGQGRDVLQGGAGADVLRGGGGADTFVFTSRRDSLLSTSDVIRDFQPGVDKIDLSLFNSAGSFVTGGTFSSVAGQVVFDLAARTVFGDMNGDGVADFGIQLTPNVVITGSDFLF